MINKEIDYILKVAEYSSILEASKKLYITPSALSKYIQGLEKKHDVKLFDRVGKKFVLTHAGERYLYWARKQADIMHEMNTELSNIANSEAGVIKVGVQFTVSDFWIENVLKDFRKRHPNIDFEITDDINTNINEAVLNNELDFCISGIEEDNKDLSQTHLLDDPLILVAPPGDNRFEKLAKKVKGHKYKFVPIEACNGHDFVLSHKSQTGRKQTDAVLEKYNVQINNYINAKSVTTILHGVYCGLGISILPALPVSMNRYYDELQKYMLEDWPVKQGWGILHNKNHFITDSVNELMNSTIFAFRKWHKEQLG